MKAKINRTVLELIQGDITDQTADVIVNAANAALLLGLGLKFNSLPRFVICLFSENFENES